MGVTAPMIEAKDLRDTYLNTKHRIVLTQEQLHIPGLRMFGHHAIYSALPFLQWHYHENSFEINVPVKGNFSFDTPDRNYSFRGGDIFITFPNEIHGSGTDHIGLGELYWFQLDISDEENFLFLCPQAAREMIRQLKSISTLLIHTENQKILPLIETAFTYAYNTDNCYITASFLQLFLHLTIQYAQKENPHISLNILKTLDYIQSNITLELSLEQLADLSGLSCSQFKLNFKKQLGISPRHYINKQKIEYAKTLLLEGTSVTETAMLLSFTSSNYFSTVFKKFTSYTPLEFVSKCREQKHTI